MENNVLLVAFHYPPYGFSSGVHRTYKFSKYLPNFGWIPHVLTANPLAYDHVIEWDDDIEEVTVTRAFALDTMRHLGINGRYPGILALPDRWISWAPGAIFSGIGLIKRYKPKIIWTTYPITTTHLIGIILHKITRIPWVADFRDPMVDSKHPTGIVKRWMFKKVELLTLKNATVCCFTTMGALEEYKLKYPQLNSEKWLMLNNGYDEDDFLDIDMSTNQEKSTNKKITLLHSGTIYKLHRDPTHFFMSIQILKKEKYLSKENITIKFRATGNDEYVKQLAEKYDITDIVDILPSIDHKEALQEMVKSDGLILIQAADCNQQIPAKIYEYLRTFRPIFALTDKAGDTAKLLNQFGLSNITSLDNVNEITSGLHAFIHMLRAGNPSIPDKKMVKEYSRKNQSKKLATIFDEICNLPVT
jgi:hypothetical protein